MATSPSTRWQSVGRRRRAAARPRSHSSTAGPLPGTPAAYNPVVTSSADPVALSHYVSSNRAAWAALRAATPLPLSGPQLRGLVGLNEPVSLDEVADVYLPLSRLLNLYVAATQSLHEATATFLGASTRRVPFVIGVAGSVAVGKSTTSRILQALLARWPSHPQVALVTTDGFLLPQRVLEARGLAERKGFPESYDVRRLVRFMADVKAGVAEVAAPVYSHLAYDIVPDERQIVRRPDIVIVEVSTCCRRGAARGPARCRFSCRISSTSRFTWTRPRRTSRHGTWSGSWRCARPCSGTRHRTSTAMLG